VKARYVLIACTKINTAYGYSIFENEVLGPKGTVLPTEEYPDLLNARKDGEPDWTIADEQWFEIDLGSEKTVDGIHLAFKS
ncbi:MAG: discoidin domain-containing protein, partial [Clostridiales bacterium]|nr:discoidin domain-containing protein [Clostridiales bacterium]